MARVFRHESQTPTFTLTQGARLLSVSRGDKHVQVDLKGVAAITVQMEAGQGGLVPWARVRHTDGTVQGMNLGTVDDVEFLDRLPVMVDEDEEVACALA